MTEFSDLRLKACLSVEQAAGFLEVSVRTAYRYERNETRPRPRDLRTLKGLIASRTTLKSPQATAFRFIDLFAGIGGLRIGFEAIGGECVFTSEWDKYAQATYRANFPEDDEERHTFAGDIREVTQDKKNLDRIPQHDVLLAGFPCQPFSIAGVTKKNSLGRPHGFMCDTQGTLFYDVAKIIAHHKPAVFVLENVKNLERHDKGKTFGTILHTLQNELGYYVDFRVINSEPWVPQKRERIFIVGFREPTAFCFENFRSPSLPGPRLGTILEPEADVSEKYVLTEHLWKYLRAYKEKHTSLGNGFGYSVFGPDDVTRTLSARYFKDGSEVLVDRGPGRRPRRLTPKECARLMGFYRKDGSDWFIPVSDTQAYKQFGNAVVVPVVRAVAKHVQPHILDALGATAGTPLRSGTEQIPLPVHG